MTAVSTRRRALAVYAAGCLACVSIALGSCGGDSGTIVAEPGAPNFVVVMTDDQAIGSLSLMPTVRRELVRTGMTFKRSFVTTPECCPSRASFFTGQYSHNHGVLSADPPEGGYQALTDREDILPAWLQGAGYETAHVGKYLNGYGIADLGSSPTEVPTGWDYWAVPANHTEYQMYGYTLNQNGELHTYGHRPRDYQTDVLTDQALAFLRSSTRSVPFFLSVAPVAPHSEGVLDNRPNATRDPRPAPRDLGTLENLPTPRPPSFGAPVRHAPPLVRHKIQRRASRLASPETRGDFLGRSESLLAVDDMVGRLVSALRARGELHDTYFIFTSDNGFLLGEHGLVGKVLPYEESIRVPLVIRGPGIDPGSTTDQLVANIDLAPTIAALAGATPGRVEDGESLVPLLRGGRLPPRDLLMELLTGREAFRAIRTDRWMLDHYEDGGSELYDTKRDPYELRNLARSPRYAGIRARLDRRLHALRDCAGSSCR